MRRAEPIVVFATGPGGTTIDRDEYGGNPFATALIELSDAPIPSLQRMLSALRALTIKRSDHHQIPQWPSRLRPLKWSFPLPAGSRGERRMALVLIVSAYARGAVQPLAGAATDERRVASMLARHGFSVSQGIHPSRVGIARALTSFSRRSRDCDVAVIYSTGHGVEVGGDVFLLPADYPFQDGYAPNVVRARAIPIPRIAMAGHGSKLNLVFFAGCRTRFGPEAN